MAEKEDDLDIDSEGSEKPKSKKLLVIGLITLMMAISGGGAWFFAAKTMSSQSTDEQSEEGDISAEEKLPLNYVPLSPAFVVNFDGTVEISFLQVTIQVGTRDTEAVDVIKEHRPAIRNSLIMLFSSQNPADLNDREGKDSLRSDALAEVQRVMEAETGAKVIENIYFTSFVMQ